MQNGESKLQNEETTSVERISPSCPNQGQLICVLVSHVLEEFGQAQFEIYTPIFTGGNCAHGVVQVDVSFALLESPERVLAVLTVGPATRIAFITSMLFFLMLVPFARCNVWPAAYDTSEFDIWVVLFRVLVQL